jgi:hypothetical protein
VRRRYDDDAQRSGVTREGAPPGRGAGLLSGFPDILPGRRPES